MNPDSLGSGSFQPGRIRIFVSVPDLSLHTNELKADSRLNRFPLKSLKRLKSLARGLLRTGTLKICPLPTKFA